MIIDATGAILGRLASYTAKKALNGEEVIIVNAEKAVVSGAKTDILKRYKFKMDVGDSIKGPFHSRMPDRMVRRTIRGMLPWKTARGKEAFKKIKVHIGEPASITGEKTRLDKTGKDTLKDPKYVSITEISKWLKSR